MKLFVVLIICVSILLSPAAGKGVQRISVPATEQEPLIIPEPRFAQRLPGEFTITPTTRILIGRSDDRMDRRPAEEINEELALVAGFTLPIEVIYGDVSTKDCIIVGERILNPAVDRFCRDHDIPLSAVYPREGYALEVGTGCILVAGSDQAGTFWGAETLRQLIRKDARVPCISVRDWPRFAYRGIHIYSAPDALKFHGKMIERIHSRYKINNIVIQAEQIEWESHPEVTDPTRAMSKADVRKLLEIARDHHITVTPILEAFSHFKWGFYNGANADLAEDPVAKYAYCPRNPKVHQFVNDVLDEMIELFGHPEYVHMGLDEIDIRGEFPFHEECKQIGKEQLYIDEVVRLHDVLASKGCKMATWGDELTKPGFAERIGQVPKDILICDWRYSNRIVYPTLDFYKRNGFRTIGCSWYLPQNIYHFNLEAGKRGIYGTMKTTWTGFDPEEKVLADKSYDAWSDIMGAAWSWSPGRPTLTGMTWEPDQVFRQVWNAGEPKKASAWYAVDLEPYRNKSLADRDTFDLSGMPTGVDNLGGIPYDLGRKHSAILLSKEVTGIPVGVKADRLHFLHTTASVGKGTVARYVVRYADGTTADIPAVYYDNIAVWNAVRLYAHTRSAWRGTTPSGETARANTFTWENPHPEKPMASLDLIPTGSASPVVLAVTVEVIGR